MPLFVPNCVKVVFTLTKWGVDELRSCGIESYDTYDIRLSY
jgi:hypothetical protein